MEIFLNCSLSGKQDALNVTTANQCGTRFSGPPINPLLVIFMWVQKTMKSLEEIEGVWEEPEFPSGLILRCHGARKKPIDRLSDLELATLLEQEIGVQHILPEAIWRVARNQPDDTEWFDGQLKEAVEAKTKPNKGMHRTADRSGSR